MHCCFVVVSQLYGHGTRISRSRIPRVSGKRVALTHSMTSAGDCLLFSLGEAGMGSGQRLRAEVLERHCHPCFRFQLSPFLAAWLWASYFTERPLFSLKPSESWKPPSGLDCGLSECT